MSETSEAWDFWKMSYAWCSLFVLKLWWSMVGRLLKYWLAYRYWGHENIDYFLSFLPKKERAEHYGSYDNLWNFKEQDVRGDVKCFFFFCFCF